MSDKQDYYAQLIHKRQQSRFNRNVDKMAQTGHFRPHIAMRWIGKTRLMTLMEKLNHQISANDPSWVGTFNAITSLVHTAHNHLETTDANLPSETGPGGTEVTTGESVHGPKITTEITKVNQDLTHRLIKKSTELPSLWRPSEHTETIGKLVGMSGLKLAHTDHGPGSLFGKDHEGIFGRRSIEDQSKVRSLASSLHQHLAKDENGAPPLTHSHVAQLAAKISRQVGEENNTHKTMLATIAVLKANNLLPGGIVESHIPDIHLMLGTMRHPTPAAEAGNKSEEALTKSQIKRGKNLLDIGSDFVREHLVKGYNPSGGSQ